MINMPGGPEIVVIAAIALLFFGPRKLPELARSIGQGIAQFKKAVNEASAQFHEVTRDLDRAANAETRTVDVPPPAQSTPEPYYEEPKTDLEKRRDDRRLGPLA